MHFAGVMVPGVGPIGFSGSFSKSAAPSGGYVTSDTITVSVPGGNTGELLVAYGTTVGVVEGLESSVNGAGFVSFPDSGTITLANGDTLAIRAGGGGGGSIVSGESQEFSLRDVTRGNLVLGTYTLAAP